MKAKKTPQVKPDWNTGIYIGNGVVAKPKSLDQRILAYEANMYKMITGSILKIKA